MLLDPAVWVPPPLALEYAEEARADTSFASLEEAIADARARNDGSSPEALAALEEDLRELLVLSPDGRLRLRRCASAVVTAFSEMATPPPLDRIDVPTLLVRGASSHVVPEVLVDVVSEELGDHLTVVTVPGGHSVLWDAFTETADAVERFLSAA